MDKTQSPKQYGLEERTFKFAKDCRTFVKEISKTIGNIEDGKQLVRSSGSTHAKFIEAVECFTEKDFYHRIRICRKEAKESRSWILLIEVSGNRDLEERQRVLAQEALELTRIFGSILEKKNKKKE